MGEGGRRLNGGTKRFFLSTFLFYIEWTENEANLKSKKNNKNVKEDIGKKMNCLDSVRPSVSI